MCYLVRQHAAAAEHGTAAQPAAPDRHWSRWAGAPSPVPPAARTQETAAMVRTEAVATPPQVGAGQRTQMVDDGVPGTPELGKAAFGHCDHGL